MPKSLEELRAFHDSICQESRPEDLFTTARGEAVDEEFLQQEVQRCYREWIAAYHPDLYCHQGATARYLSGEIARCLHALRDAALQRIREGVFGRESPAGSRPTSVVIRTRDREYRVAEKLAEGTVADVFLGECDAPEGGTEAVCIKMARDAADNALIRCEQGILRDVKHKSMPCMVEAFTTGDGRAATVLRYLEGSLDLVALREHPSYRAGVPQEHVCWMLERLLSVLGYLHVNVLVHGNLEPGNILVRPRDHNVFLVDFVFSVRNPTVDDYIRCATEPYCAPEVLEKRPPLPTTDLFSLGQCMIHALGGDPATGRIPAEVDARLVNLLRHPRAPGSAPAGEGRVGDARDVGAVAHRDVRTPSLRRSSRLTSIRAGPSPGGIAQRSLRSRSTPCWTSRQPIPRSPPPCPRW